MGKDTRSQGYTFLYCCDLQSKDTRSYICKISFCWEWLQGQKFTIICAIDTQMMTVSVVLCCVSPFIIILKVTTAQIVVTLLPVPPNKGIIYV